MLKFEKRRKNKGQFYLITLIEILISIIKI